MEVLPINAIVYNQEKVNIKDVIAPPYDVIDSQYQDDLYSRSEFNIVKLILTKGENRYSDASKYFEDWKNKEVLVHTQKPSIFYIVQRYKNEKGKTIERKGFIARNKIEDFESKKILPHEYTMGGPKQDRLNLVEACGAFFSQIFMVYNDKEQKIEKMAQKYFSQKPYMDVVDDLGVQNIVYLIDDTEDIKLVQQTLSDKTLLIADGHHRYETSMNYSKAHNDNEYAKYVMSYFTNAADENLVIYPTHRIIEKEIFGSKELGKILEKKFYNEMEFVGLVSNICVISNAVIARTFSKESVIIVDALCTDSFDKELFLIIYTNGVVTFRSNFFDGIYVSLENIDFSNTEIVLKDIKGFEGLYAITEDGRVWSYSSNKWRKLAISPKGYYTVQLSKEGKVYNFLVHRLVYNTFKGEIPEGLTVDHIDGNKINNTLDTKCQTKYQTDKSCSHEASTTFDKFGFESLVESYDTALCLFYYFFSLNYRSFNSCRIYSYFLSYRSSLSCILSHYCNASERKHCQHRKGCKNFFHTICFLVLNCL